MFDIIYENTDFLVLNKQANIPMYDDKNKFVNIRHTVASLLAQYNSLFSSLPRYGIVHRLDKDTTGACLIAKNLRTLIYLQNLLRQKYIKRTYLGLVIGTPTKSAGIIDTYVKKLQVHKRMVIAKLNTKDKTYRAVTHYNVIQSFKYYSLVRFLLVTGKTHQIRLHMQHINHDIVGDKTYSRTKLSQISRQMLHASSLKFVYNQKDWNFEALVPEDMTKIIDTLKHHNDYLFT
jgi:23S rRNA pseudouridine1911/1915/1917 synthase